MRIDAGSLSRYIPQAFMTPRGVLPSSSPAAVTATEPTSTTASGLRKLDFTSMTRQELRDRINEEIRSGRMTVDDSTPFVGLTFKMRIDGTDVPAATDTETIDFVKRVRDGIAGAHWRGEADSAARLEWAQRWMEARQGETVGVDVRG